MQRKQTFLLLVPVAFGLGVYLWEKQVFGQLRSGFKIGFLPMFLGESLLIASPRKWQGILKPVLS